jgi:hypothetical protein
MVCATAHAANNRIAVRIDEAMFIVAKVKRVDQPIDECSHSRASATP